MKCPFGWPTSRLSSSERRSATNAVDVAEDSVCSFPVLSKGQRMGSEKVSLHNLSEDKCDEKLDVCI